MQEYSKRQLSIIIPVYNVEKYITRCLESIYSQGIDESLFEVIAINDGSIDNSFQILEEFGKLHGNLYIHTQENKGLSCARNKGIELATGEYIWFIDSDDWITGDSLSIVLKNTEKGYNVISTNLIYSYDDSSKNHIERDTVYDKVILPHDYIINYSLGASQRYIIKRKYLKMHGITFYPGIYHEDAEFGPRLIAPCKKVYMLATPVYHYYQRESGSIMSSWKLKNSKDATFIAQKTLEYSKDIADKKIKDSIVYAAFRTLMFAFGKNCTMDSEIKILYYKKKPLMRKMAFKALFAQGIGFRKHILALACAISPQLYYRLNK